MQNETLVDDDWRGGNGMVRMDCSGMYGWN